MSHIGEDEKTPTEKFGARELRLSRFRVSEVSDEAETGRTCPKCDGAGMVGEDTGATYMSLECNLCNGACWVTESVASDYRARNAVGQSTVWA